MAQYVIVEAADGYRAAFAVAELDPAFTDRVILLADHRDGKPLSTQSGPLQIIVPGETQHQPGGDEDEHHKRLVASKFQEIPIRVELLVRFEVHPKAETKGPAGN